MEIKKIKLAKYYYSLMKTTSILNAKNVVMVLFHFGKLKFDIFVDLYNEAKQKF